jgi:nitrogen-specific signal transduction histidine kinase
VIGAERTLLSFLDAPVVVGDPEGCAVYANPAFEARFARAAGRVPGIPLAELFEGGAREAVLRAVVAACRQGESVRFRLREGGVGFSAVASPIEAQGEQVGVVILLKEEVEGVERVLALHRRMEQPLDELAHALEQLVEHLREARPRALADDALRSLARVRKAADEVHAVLTGAPGAGSEPKPARAARRFDPGALLHRVAGRMARAFEEGDTRLDVVAKPALPPLVCDEHRLESLLLRLLEARLAQQPPPERVLLGARVAGAGGASSLLISLSELGRAAFEASFPDAPVEREEAAALGAEIHGAVHPRLGRVTLVRLRTAG